MKTEPTLTPAEATPRNAGDVIELWAIWIGDRLLRMDLNERTATTIAAGYNEHMQGSGKPLAVVLKCRARILPD